MKLINIFVLNLKYILNRINPTFVERPMIKNIKGNSLIGLEIGSHRGENAYNILKTKDIKELYLIDPYNEVEHFYKAKKVLKRYDFVKFIIAKSEDVIDIIPNNLDFVYIDGNHEYDYVKRDLEMYYPKVKKGGIIGGHDFCGSNQGVCKAVLEYCDKNNLELESWDKDWWIVK